MESVDLQVLEAVRRWRLLQVGARCAVVALTHDPKLDNLLLLEALPSPAFYVGAVGSRANNARRRKSPSPSRPRSPPSATARRSRNV